ncbi:hypothetical protein M3J09_012178 [Ascochyta lentis]
MYLPSYSMVQKSTSVRRDLDAERSVLCRLGRRFNASNRSGSANRQRRARTFNTLETQRTLIACCISHPASSLSTALTRPPALAPDCVRNTCSFSLRAYMHSDITFRPRVCAPTQLLEPNQVHCTEVVQRPASSPHRG